MEKLSLCALRDITGDHKTPRKLKQLSFLRDAHADSPRKGASFLRGALKFALDENDDINLCVDEINKLCYDDPKQNTAAFLLQINRPYPKDIIKQFKDLVGYKIQDAIVYLCAKLTEYEQEVPIRRIGESEKKYLSRLFSRVDAYTKTQSTGVRPRTLASMKGIRHKCVCSGTCSKCRDVLKEGSRCRICESLDTKLAGTWNKSLSQEERLEQNDTFMSTQQLHDLCMNQEWKCAISGVPLEFIKHSTVPERKGYKHPLKFSMDRHVVLGTDGGLYTEGNVRVTTCIANSAKNVYSDEALMDLCLAVVLKNRDNPSIANALSTICSRQFTKNM